MRDYEELVERLRICPDYNDGCKNCPHEHDLGCRSTTMREAADTIEELVSNADKFKWIGVEEKLPEKYHQVLVYGQNGLQIDYYAGAKSVCGNPLFMISEAKATHWMPLPEPPKEDDNA